MAFKISGSHIIADSSEEEILRAGPMRRKAQRAGFRRMVAVAALVERLRPVGGESPPTSPAAVQAVKPAKAKAKAKTKRKRYFGYSSLVAAPEPRQTGSTARRRKHCL